MQQDDWSTTTSVTVYGAWGGTKDSGDCCANSPCSVTTDSQAWANAPPDCDGCGSSVDYGWCSTFPGGAQTVNGCGSGGYGCSIITEIGCVHLENCGDRIIDGLEECDDGNTASGDGCDSSCQTEEQDIGLRMYDGISIISIAIQTTLTSPLRISKDGITYGIALVDPSDSFATKFRIATSSGMKAIKRLP
ncbi:MAG: DUF4215 domain-containing protein [Patescibacteria group bacterium]